MFPHYLNIEYSNMLPYPLATAPRSNYSHNTVAQSPL